MAVGTNRWKLGLFVLTGIAIAMGALLLLGARALQQNTVQFVSFFDESVQGLELGSPVKFRGVTVGKVSSIDIAEDLRHVQVTSDLSVEQVGRLRLSVKGDGSKLHPNMRVQLNQTGITGVKFLLIDFFDSSANPVPVLPFKPPKNYIPTASSTMKNLEDSVTRTANRFPEIADDTAKAVAQVRLVAEQIQSGRLPERGIETLSHANRALMELNAQLKAINAAQLSSSADQSLNELSAVLTRADALLARLDGEKGLFRNAERSTEAIGEVARNARSLGPELELTLREIRGAARSVKRLADELERDPDMLIKGRAGRPAP